MASSEQGSAPKTAEGLLVLDTGRIRHPRGARGASVDRRLLFHAPNAHVEVRLPNAVDGSEDAAWLHGQFVWQGSASGRVHVTLVPDAGETRTTVASETGDFSLPCAGVASPFWLECRTAAGDLVRVRCDA